MKNLLIILSLFFTLILSGFNVNKTLEDEVKITLIKHYGENIILFNFINNKKSFNVDVERTTDKEEQFCFSVKGNYKINNASITIGKLFISKSN